MVGVGGGGGGVGGIKVVERGGRCDRGKEKVKGRGLEGKGCEGV